ncbi:Enoyl-CoA hydratase/isomerase-like protein 4 [Elsinoe fawcettii]|nr:Enoyl-CoA hydratase/isomerase-like protein 4 [Elsinoe fawcettii]
MPLQRLTRVVLSPRTIAAYHVPRKHYSTPTPTLKLTSIPAPHSGSIKILSLNRPSARNAISKQLLSDLSHEIETIHSEHADGASGSTRAVILASESDACFCAGADLKERLTFTPEETSAFLAKLRGTFSRLAQLPIPTISAISSTAFGGGLELALCTHLRVFSSTSLVALPETRLAIIPGAGGTFRLPGIIGQSRARDMIITGRRVGGPEAYFLGLCDRLVDVDMEETKQEGVARKKVLDAAVQLARDICEGGPVAIKAALEAVEGCGLGQESENRAYDKVLVTKDRIEALKAFGEKRKPVFMGR